MNLAVPTFAPFNNPLVKFVAEPKYRWARHIAFLIISLILGFKGDVGAYNETRPPEQIQAFLLVDFWTFTFIMSIMYLLILYMIPRLLFGGKVFRFALWFFVFVSSIYFVVWYVDYRFLMALETDPKRQMLQHIELSFLAYIQYCAIASVLLGSVVGMAIFKKWVNDVKHMNELQQANVRTELEQLKSQVNPHFLFNTLNNLYVLMKVDVQKATQLLLGLSDLLRYQLYDSAKGEILLVKDIDFIKNLLSLEKIRKNDFDYTIESSGIDERIHLPPFLFIPFVENAIKHGSTSFGHAYLKLKFDYSGDTLHFTSENSKPIIKKQEIGGIGLVNIKRRLELLFPDKHRLDITEDRDTYTINLYLNEVYRN